MTWEQLINESVALELKILLERDYRQRSIQQDRLDRLHRELKRRRSLED